MSIPEHGLFTMDNILPVLDRVFTPGTTVFSDYVRYATDCNGDFYRTCYRKKAEPIDNQYYGYRKTTHIVVAFEENVPINKDSFSFEKEGNVELTRLQMQLCPVKESHIDECIQWNIDMGYPCYRVVDLINHEEITGKYPPAKYRYTEYPCEKKQRFFHPDGGNLE